MTKRILILLTSFVLIMGQEIPNQFLQFQLQKLRTDTGENWERNTTFGSLRFNYGNISLILGMSEILVYSGRNRPIDFAYFNPMSTHLEIELNERQNLEGTGSENGVWQISADWLIRNNIRILGNYLFDKFVLDKEQKQEGKGHGCAHSTMDTRIILLALSQVEMLKQFYLQRAGCSGGGSKIFLS